MKILIVGLGNKPWDLKFGDRRVRSGGETKLIELIKRWSNIGIKISMLCPQSTYVVYSMEIPCINYYMLPVMCDRYWILGSFEIFLKRVVSSVFYRINERFDIVYSASDLFYDLIPAIIMARKCKAKLVSCLFLIARSPLERYSNRSLSGIFFFYMQKGCIWLLRKRSDMVLVLNNLDRQRLLMKYFPQEKVKVVSGGINIKFINDINPIPQKYDGVFVGRFHPQKGLFDLIDIWAEVCRKKPEAKLIIIGGGNRKWFKRLETQIAKYNLQSNVEIKGFCSRENIFAILKNSKIFIFPSFHESWGIVAVEAMACGIPVVSYDLLVFKELFTQGILKVPIGDKTKFADSILKLLDDEIKRITLGIEAKGMAMKYDWDNIAQEELKYLEDLIGAEV